MAEFWCCTDLAFIFASVRRFDRPEKMRNCFGDKEESKRKHVMVFHGEGIMDRQILLTRKEDSKKPSNGLPFLVADLL